MWKIYHAALVCCLCNLCAWFYFPLSGFIVCLVLSASLFLVHYKFSFRDFRFHLVPLTDCFNYYHVWARTMLGGVTEREVVERTPQHNLNSSRGNNLRFYSGVNLFKSPKSVDSNSTNMGNNLSGHLRHRDSSTNTVMSLPSPVRVRRLSKENLGDRLELSGNKLSTPSPILKCEGQPSPLVSSSRFNSNSDELLHIDAMSPGFVSRIADKANIFALGEFPVVHFNDGLNQKNTLKMKKETRPVKVHIAPPNSSTMGLSDTSIDQQMEVPDNSMKTVLQVLKGLSRKRIHIPADEDDSTEIMTKRQKPTEHNLYLSQLETSMQIGEKPMHGKRARENAPTGHEMKRQRRVRFGSSSNEIVSSLSSSVGITPPHLTKKRKARVTQPRSETPVQVEKQPKNSSSPTTPDIVSILKVPSKKPSPMVEEREASSEDFKSCNAQNKQSLTTKEAAYPTPESSEEVSRSPTSKVEVTRPMVNALLKSAISKFVASGDSNLIPVTKAKEMTPPTPAHLPMSPAPMTPTNTPPTPVPAPLTPIMTPLPQVPIPMSPAVTPVVPETPRTTMGQSFTLKSTESSGMVPVTVSSTGFNFPAPTPPQPEVAKLDSSLKSPDNPFQKLAAATTSGSPKPAEPKPEFQFNPPAPKSDPPKEPAPAVSEPAKPEEKKSEGMFTFGANKGFAFGAEKTSGFGFPTPTTQNDKPGFKFGSETPATTASNTEFVFGKPKDTPPKPSFGSSVFGSSAPAFGSTTTTSQPTGLFSTTTTTSSEPAKTSIFNAPKTPSIFGEANKPASKPDMFGQKLFSSNRTSQLTTPSETPATTTQSGIFGAPKTTTSMFSTSTSTTQANTLSKTTFGTFGEKKPEGGAFQGGTFTTQASGFGSGGFAFGAPATQVNGSGGDSKPGGFAFNLNTGATKPPESSKPAFSFQATQVPSTFNFTASAPSSGFSGASSPFGNTQQQSGFKSPVFGASQTRTTQAFGAPQTQTAPAFGAPQAQATPAFGVPQTQTTPAFGVPTTQSTPAFGAPTTQVTPAFGAPTTQTTPAFGAPSTQTTPAFGAPTTQATPAFGASQTQATPAFGASTTQTTPAFGASATQTAPAFGASQTPTTQAFGTQPQPASVFSSPNRSFGSNSFGNTSFGTGQQQQQPQAPTFGASATPAFGSSTFGSSTQPTFGATTQQQSTFRPSAPIFGSSSTAVDKPAFGVPTFGQTPSANSFNPTPTKPFAFGAQSTPANAQTSGVFTFGQSSAPTQSTFQFNASGSQTPTPGFNFNASASTFSLGGATGGQAMFSIGSGSTAPRSRTLRARKR